MFQTPSEVEWLTCADRTLALCRGQMRCVRTLKLFCNAATRHKCRSARSRSLWRHSSRSALSMASSNPEKQGALSTGHARSKSLPNLCSSSRVTKHIATIWRSVMPIVTGSTESGAIRYGGGNSGRSFLGPNRHLRYFRLERTPAIKLGKSNFRVYSEAIAAPGISTTANERQMRAPAV